MTIATDYERIAQLEKRVSELEKRLFTLWKKGRDMTPERAAELAAMTTQCNAQGDALITVQQAILHACNEQRETDAKICEEHYTIEGIAQRCAVAIREGK